MKAAPIVEELFAKLRRALRVAMPVYREPNLQNCMQTTRKAEMAHIRRGLVIVSIFIPY